jgi:hypothetical protein
VPTSRFSQKPVGTWADLGADTQRLEYQRQYPMKPFGSMKQQKIRRNRFHTITCRITSFDWFAAEQDSMKKCSASKRANKLRRGINSGLG